MDNLKEIEEDEKNDFPVNDENIYESFNSSNINDNNNITNIENDSIYISIDIMKRNDNDNNSKPKELGVINKDIKKNIENFFQRYNYQDSRNLVRLYTSEYKFDKYINKWLLSLNYEIYSNISPITGKIINVLYGDIAKRSSKLTSKKRIVLFRGLSIKKADIFLYKACEGDRMCYPSFMSTSTKIGEAANFAEDGKIDMTNLGEMCPCLIYIEYFLENNLKVQEGDIKNYSDFKDEEERLFPPFSFFNIEKVKMNNDISGNNIFNGTKEHPFEIRLKIINRNFYLDQAILTNQEFDYDKNKNMWILKNKN